LFGAGAKIICCAKAGVAAMAAIAVAKRIRFIVISFLFPFVNPQWRNFGSVSGRASHKIYARAAHEMQRRLSPFREPTDSGI
jgi:hypothetical protein